MAVCMDDVLDNAIVEQTDELVALQSIYEDKFHLIRAYNKNENNRIEFNLTLSVRHPFERVTVEAVIPVNEPLDSSSDSDEDDRTEVQENLECKVQNDDDDGNNIAASEDNGLNLQNNNEPLDSISSNASSSSTRQKPGLSRLLSTKHWHIKSEVSDLTPIYLWCRFPPLYPPEDPPEVILSCDWLSSAQIQKLSVALENLWQENLHEPIIFSWGDWLENSSWEFLELSSHLILREGFKDCSFNDGVTDVALEMSLLNIFEHDLEIKQKEFHKGIHTCEICYEEKEGQHFCLLDECRHFCCRECLKLHCEMHIKSGTIMQLICPIHDCDVTLTPQVLKGLLEEDVYKRWERLLLSKTLDMMRDIFYCPRCSTAVVADDDVDSSRLVQCASCYFAFCIECQGPWHHGKSCTEDEEVKVEGNKKAKKKRKKAKHDQDDDDEESDQKKSTKRMGRHSNSMVFIMKMKSKGSYKNCPKCRMVIEKNDGCNYMTCSQCGGHFCWICGKSITSYNHFSQSAKCTTFYTPPVHLAAVQEPTQGEIIIRQYRKYNPGQKVRTKYCSTCSQKNVKVANNNHIKCWSCKTRFCYQCGKKIEDESCPHWM